MGFLKYPTKPEPVEGWNVAGFDRLNPRIEIKNPRQMTEIRLYNK